MGDKSKLAAILYADIAGYTAVMQKNESAGLQLVSDYNVILREVISLYDGELVKSYGDSTLVLYSSSLDALKCAEDLQKRFIKAKIPVRIGAHLGEVLYRDGDYYGDSINIASRLESVASPNSILLSDTMAAVVRNKDGISLKSIGDYDFKNVDHPIAVYALVSKGIKVPSSNNSASGKGRTITKAERELDKLEKKKKQFSTLAGMLGAASVFFIGLYFAGITPMQSLSVLLTIFLSSGIFFYFTFFGFRFDIYGVPDDGEDLDDDDMEDGSWVEKRDASDGISKEEKALELKHLEKMKATRDRGEKEV